MNKVESVAYATPTGTVVEVSHHRPEWIVAEDGYARTFASVPAWIAFVRQSHGWPLPLVSVVPSGEVL